MKYCTKIFAYCDEKWQINYEYRLFALRMLKKDEMFL